MLDASTQIECVALPCEPQSASAARRFAREILRAWGSEDIDDILTLLLSEVVTNALLHAGSPVDVCLAQQSRGVRVEVADHSTSVPRELNYAEDATTGRGLGLVEALASGWGVHPKPDGGKVVWFEVGGDATRTTPPISAPEDLTPGVIVHLLSAPVLLFPAMQQHLDALIREYALLSAGSSPEWHAPQLHIDFSSAAHTLRAAGDGGRNTADVSVTVSPAAMEDFETACNIIDEADELSERGALLVPPALPEIRACRQWVLTQVAEQIGGGEPTPWQVPQSATVAERIEFDGAEALGAVTTAVVVADNHNRILFANPAAERMLGWEEGGLAGRRLTTIIPQRLRDAHIAGYSRYLVTGEPRLIGKPAYVPALRRDGTEIGVWLHLAEAGGGGSGRASGHPVFVASLLQDDSPEQVEGTASPALRMLQTLRTVTVGDSAGGDDDTTKAALSALARAGRWQTACWWAVAGETLQCAVVWTDPNGDYDAFVRASLAAGFPAGVGLPGRVWQSGEASWLTDVVADSNFPRARAAATCGLRAACAVPVSAHAGVVAVIELLGTGARAADDDLIAAYTVAGRLLAPPLTP